MQRIAGYGDSMVQFADATQQSWKDGETLDIAEEMMTLTLRIVGKTLFNADTTELSERVGHAMSLLMYWFPIQMLPYGVMLERLPLPAMRRLHAAREDLNNIVLNIIAERRASARDEGDLLSMLLAAQEEDGAGLDNEQVRDEALTLFVAGHETTANALAWTWYLLAQHPDIAARLRTEIDTVLGDATPTYADVRRLPFTESVITESLRLYPPAWTIVRTPVENVELAGLPGYTLPHGSTVMACSWVMHRLERYFPDPESFRPDRWTPEFRAGLPKFAYFPFGGGPRSCIGESFAWMELILIVAVIARRWDMTLLANHQETVRLQPAVTLRPRNGINVTLRRREV
jgi:cytochrome P450